MFQIKKMPNSQVIDEAIHAETVHKDLQRIVAVSIDEGSADYVFDWAVNNFINPKTDLVRIREKSGDIKFKKTV